MYSCGRCINVKRGHIFFFIRFSDQSNVTSLKAGYAQKVLAWKNICVYILQISDGELWVLQLKSKIVGLCILMCVITVELNSKPPVLIERKIAQEMDRAFLSAGNKNGGNPLK